jgi:hypothetical protein
MGLIKAAVTASFIFIMQLYTTNFDFIFHRGKGQPPRPSFFAAKTVGNSWNAL